MSDAYPEATGKTLAAHVLGHAMCLLNQRSEEWTALYDYASPPRGTLHDSGCGLFSIAHGVQFVTGTCVDVEELAVFSMASGGCEDDGTNRPVLLSAMRDSGRLQTLGFRYDGEGHVNDPERLFAFLLRGEGFALGNLRVGHIVALCAAREADGEHQVLALDSYSESNDDRVRPYVRECIPGTLCVTHGAETVMGHMAYWIPASRTRDVNYLVSMKGARP